MTRDDLDAMVRAYLECAIWSGIDADENGNIVSLDNENYDRGDIAPESVDAIRAECEAFYDENAADLAAMDAEQAGHDLCLTRNHHGAGYWDRGLGELGDRLTKAAHAYGSSDLYIGDDGRLYAS